MDTIVVGLLGPDLDASGKNRWERWRPSVALCQHEDLLVRRFELLYQRRFQRLADQVVRDIATVSPETEVRPRLVDIRDAWDFEEVYGVLHDFARSYPFDPEREDYLVHITTGSHVAQICLYLLTEARYLPARLLQTSPPRQREPGSEGHFTVIDLDLSRYDHIATRFVRERREGQSFLKSGIATRDEPFNRMIERIEQVALSSPDPILLLGPTGAGKSQLARRIHELKRQRRLVAGPLVEVNCATLRGDAAMSTLFGHVAGAFTGALKDRPGMLRAAHEGILFLDEIGDLGLDEQAMLLRALEEKTFFPLGADQESTSDFQLIAGTHRDLKREVAASRFREDLLARIDLWTFRLPGLADRRDDIEPNIDYELERHASGSGRQARFNKEARERFVAWGTSAEAVWRANFRDLNAAINRMATLARGGRITVADVDEERERLRAAWRDEAAESLLDGLLGAEGLAALDRFDRVQLEEVVRVCRESTTLSAASRKLFAVSRTRKAKPNDADRLRKYLARYGLEFQGLQEDVG